MNLKQIMDKYTKESLLQAFYNLYPDQMNLETGYDYIFDELKYKEPVETQIVMHVEMAFVDGKDTYELYGVDDENDRIDLTMLSWGKWINLEIDSEILKYLDEKDIFAHALYVIAFNDYLDEDDFMEIISIDLNNSNADLSSSLGLLHQTLENLAAKFLEDYDIDSAGELLIKSDKLIISDSLDLKNQIIIDKIKHGKWNFTTVEYIKEKTDDDDQKDFIELSFQHESIKDVNFYLEDIMRNNNRNIKTLDTSFTPSSKLIIVKEPNEISNIEIENINGPKIINNSFVMPCGKDEGPFAIYVYSDSEENIIGIRIVLINYDKFFE